jgi:DNA mismatch repair protein MutS2
MGLQDSHSARGVACFDERSLDALEFGLLRSELLELASCPQGRHYLERLRPSPDPEQVARRQARSQQLSALMESGEAPVFDGLVEVSDLLQALTVTDSVLSGPDLARLSLLVEAGERARRLVSAPDRAEALSELAGSMPALDELERRLVRTVDESGELLDSASPQLAAIREQVRAAAAKLTRAVDGFLSRHPKLSNPIVTLRNERHVVAVPSDMAPSRMGLIQGRSSSGASFFVEPFDLVPLNNERLELRDDEQAEQRRILREVTRYLAEYAEPLMEAERLVGLLDGLRAGVELGRSLGAGRVRAASGGLSLHAARHPLLALRHGRQAVVPLDLELSPAERTLVVTGPNSGGKTVALKTVGLMVAMHQSGLPLPVESASLPIFRSLWAEIGDPQDLAQSLGTFAGRLANVKRALDGLELPALVLLDEIGSGTEPGEGAALAVAMLERFRAAGALVLATSHHEMLRSYALTTEQVVPAAMAFEESTLQPLFRMEVGRTGASRALDIARRAGLPDAILEQARGLLAGRETATDRLSSAVERRLREADAACEAARLERDQALAGAAVSSRQSDRYQAELDRLRTREREQRSQLKQRFTRHLEDALRELREQAHRLIEERLGHPDQKLDKRVDRLLAKQAAHLSSEVLARESGDEPVVGEGSALPARTGDQVRVRSLGVSGVLSRLEGERAEVEAGGMRLQVAVSDLVRLAGPALPRVQLESGVEPRPSGPSELNLIGLRVEEALERLDRFLDSAVLGSLPSVRIVHGHGSGRLKSAVRSHLRAHRQVCRVEPTEEDGATHARLEP